MAESRYVIFDLPFALLIRDSLYEEEHGKPEGLASEIFVNADIPGGVKTLLRFRTAAGVVAAGVLEGGDPYGRISCTTVQVRFHARSSPEVADWEDDELLERAVDLVNRLVSDYRAITGQPLFYPVSPVDLVHFRIVDEQPEGNPKSRVVMRGRGPLVVGISDDQKQVDRALRDRLQSPEVVPFLRDIELNAFGNLALGDHRLSVVESAVFFETWLVRRLREHFLDTGISSAEIDERFRPGGRFRTITKIARILIPEAWDFDFLESDEGKEWALRCRDLRNKVVHGERESVSRQEAESAIAAVKAACAAIVAHSERG